MPWCPYTSLQLYRCPAPRAHAIFGVFNFQSQAGYRALSIVHDVLDNIDYETVWYLFIRNSADILPSRNPCLKYNSDRPLPHSKTMRNRCISWMMLTTYYLKAQLHKGRMRLQKGTGKLVHHWKTARLSLVSWSQPIPWHVVVLPWSGRGVILKTKSRCDWRST